MKITNYTNDTIAFAVQAALLHQKATELKRLKHSVTVFVWNGYIPQQTIVSEFWPILDNMFKNDTKQYNNYKVEIVYDYAVMNDPNTIHATGFKFTYITELSHRSIVDANNQLRYNTPF